MDKVHTCEAMSTSTYLTLRERPSLQASDCGGTRQEHPLRLHLSTGGFEDSQRAGTIQACLLQEPNNLLLPSSAPIHLGFFIVNLLSRTGFKWSVTSVLI